MKEKNEENLDNEIWIQNKIEEARQETENLIYEQIKSLNYNKTVKDFNEALQKLSKQIELVDYNKDRSLEGLEEDFNIKLDDIKTLNEDALKDMIVSITGDSLDKKMESLEKKFSKEMNKSLQKLDIIKENNTTEELANNFEEYKKIVDIDTLKAKQEDLTKSVQKLEEINIDEIRTAQENITNIETKYKQDIENATSILNDAINQSINRILEDAENKQSEIEKYRSEIESKLADLEDNVNSTIEYKATLNKKMVELQHSQKNLENDFVTYQKDIENDINKYQEKIKTYQANIQKNIETSQKNINDKVNLIDEIHNKQGNIEKQITELKEEGVKLRELFSEQTKLVIPEMETAKEELFKIRENTANKLLTIEKTIDEKIIEDSKKTKKEFSKLLSELDVEGIRDRINKIDEDKDDLVAKYEELIAEKVYQNEDSEKIVELERVTKDISANLQETKYQQEEIFEQMKNYVEKRILRMKYVTTIQALIKEIDKLKNTIASMQTTSDTDATDDERIMKLVDKQVRQTINQMIKEQRTNQGKIQNPTSRANQKINQKTTERIPSNIVEKQEYSKKISTRKDMDNISLEEALKDSPVEKIVNTTRAISNIAKGIRKSQILNSPEEQD